MRYNGVIQRRLTLLDDQVQRLRRHTVDVSLEDFAESSVLRSMAERALQVAAEIVIDIAERIIALNNAGPVAGVADAIERLQTIGVIASVEPYRSMVRFRNPIVHEYEQIDPRLLHTLVTTRLDDFLRFRDEIDALG